jgi:hypothetical protein
MWAEKLKSNFADNRFGIGFIIRLISASGRYQ